MKNNLLFSFLCLVSTLTFSQKDINWEDLSKVTFVDKYYPKYQQNFPYPTFSKSVKALEGQKLTISGYFLSLDPTSEIYILSKGPMSACFFCGVGGPETAIEIHFKKKPPFKMDEIISVTGVLELNADDPEHFTYILRDCEGVKFD